MAEFDTALMDECRNAGIIPMISWAPESGWSSFPFTNLESILNGSQDAYLTAWGEAAAAWGHPFFVRLMWEFTGSWTDGIYPFGDGNTGAAEFVEAWQHVVNVVRAAGATNINWVWCPANVGDSVATLQSLYPGNNYVDWVATDIYATEGQTFSQTPQTEIDNIHTVAPDKPMMLAESGDLWTESDSAAWWNDLLTNALPNEYPYISAVVVWQDPTDSPGYTVTDSTTLPVFQQGIASSYYSSNVYGSLNISPFPAIGENPNPTPTPIPTSQPTLQPTGYPTPTPTPIPTSQPTPQPTGYPTPTPTHSPTASSSFGASDFAIIVVVAVIAFVAVVPKSRAWLFRYWSK